MVGERERANLVVRSSGFSYVTDGTAGLHTERFMIPNGMKFRNRLCTHAAWLASPQPDRSLPSLLPCQLPGGPRQTS